ncbi:GGDEF domain-containing protein [Pelagovum pacificum]|uniref:diguanylate cyclase n=1 Tax=Pelagovum pacificum TaxID=2588711 RepID=A0A5C5GI89_9RHOB|nr:GGDEF domain-containing protein [Pelagovum pacificum]QQA43231.1 GGDEF domain-containing protein [Pelagovum pacificum]TNY33629.1 GGDEF domain-containing protein [Pelagovum pacificum]
MPLYHFLSRHISAGFVAKAMLVVMAGFFVPVIGLAAYVLRSGTAGLDHSLVTVILSAVCAGMVLAVLGIRAILAPVMLVSGALDRWGRTGQMPVLPESYRDEVGLLMVRTNLMMARAQRTIDHSRRESDTDPLTGALNRRGALRMLRDAPSGWIVLIDLDHFRLLNERLGRADGDRLLRDIAQACANVLRENDILARMDGKEFLVFLPGTPRKVALRVADRLRETIGQRLVSGKLRLTASAGLAHFDGGEPVDEAIAAANEQLKRAKALGPGQACWSGQESAAA